MGWWVGVDGWVVIVEGGEGWLKQLQLNENEER